MKNIALASAAMFLAGALYVVPAQKAEALDLTGLAENAVRGLVQRQLTNRVTGSLGFNQQQYNPYYGYAQPNQSLTSRIVNGVLGRNTVQQPYLGNQYYGNQYNPYLGNQYNQYLGNNQSNQFLGNNAYGYNPYQQSGTGLSLRNIAGQLLGNSLGTW